MTECRVCHTTHVANTLFCSECGAFLPEDDEGPTDSLSTGEIGWEDALRNANDPRLFSDMDKKEG